MLNIWIEAVARGGGIEMAPGTVVLQPRKQRRSAGMARRGATLLGRALIESGCWLLARAKVEEPRRAPTGCVPA